MRKWDRRPRIEASPDIQTIYAPRARFSDRATANCTVLQVFPGYCFAEVEHRHNGTISKWCVGMSLLPDYETARNPFTYWLQSRRSKKIMRGTGSQRFDGTDAESEDVGARLQGTNVKILTGNFQGSWRQSASFTTARARACPPRFARPQSRGQNELHFRDDRHPGATSLRLTNDCATSKISSLPD